MNRFAILRAVSSGLVTAVAAVAQGTVLMVDVPADNVQTNFTAEQNGGAM